MKIKIVKFFRYLAFVIAFLILGFGFYVNYYLPHGPKVSTGEYNCQELSGGCDADYFEDLRNVDIPEWAKTIRNGNPAVWFMFIFILGMVINEEREKS